MTQVYVLPTPSGWAINVWDHPSFPNDAVVLLPFTRETPSLTVRLFVRSLFGASAYVDGWYNSQSLVKYEPTLATRVGW